MPLWDELTVGIFLDPTLVTKQLTVLMDVDISHGPGYGSARIWSATVAPHTGERKVTVVREVDVNDLRRPSFTQCKRPGKTV